MDIPENDSLSPGYFEAVYQRNSDPWDFASSAYEAAKYEATLAALPRSIYRSGFEAGCSIGVLTERLAARCERLFSVDGNAQALEQAGARCGHLSHLRLERRWLPTEFPRESFDLIVVSEIGYYFAKPDLLELRRRCISQLETGGHLLLVHWTPQVHDYPLTGDQVHETFLEAANAPGAELRHLCGRREEKYRLDLFERNPSEA